MSRQKKVIIAIDFGTAYSGFAFGWFSNEQLKYPIFYENWPGQPIAYYKTRTFLLYNPQGELEAFGWQALHRLRELREPSDVNLANGYAKDYKLFQGLDIKIKLYSQEEFDYNKEVHIFPNNKSLLLIDLIAEVLRQIRIEAIKHINGTNSALFDDKRDIKWCISIPAPAIVGEGIIASKNKSHDTAKELMREAAKKAGLISPNLNEGNSLEFVLEPEAAAITCQGRDSQALFSQMKKGTCFMVIDAGGGTVDVVTYKVTEDMVDFKLSTAAKGFADTCGSMYINQKFYQYLRNLFTDEIFDSLEGTSELLEITMAWEREKSFYNETSLNANKPIRIQLPSSIRDIPLWDKLSEQLQNKQEGKRKTEIFLNCETIKVLFHESIEKTVELVNQQFHILQSKDIYCHYIFIVGGFANSPLLQQRIRQLADEQKVRKVVVPPEAGGSVLWGSVRYGLDPSVILSRYSQLTYGICIRKEFRQGIDPESKKIYSPFRKEFMCNDRFEIFVKAGEIIKVGQKISKTFCPIEPDQKIISISVYTTHDTNPNYIDEPHVRHEADADIVIPMPNTKGGINRTVEVTMIFGLSEIQVEGKNVETGEITYGKLRFIGDYSLRAV